MKSKVAVLLVMVAALAVSASAQNIKAGENKDSGPENKPAMTADDRALSDKKAKDILSFWAELRGRYETQDNVNSKSYGEYKGTRESFLLGRVRAGLPSIPLKS